MLQDKIALALKDIAKLNSELKDIKKDMRKEEKIENEQYLQLKSAYKDLRVQIKDFENSHEDELKSNDFYNELRVMKLKKEEDLAHASQILFDAVAKLPVKPVQLKTDTEFGFLNISIQPEMRVYVNGKEEKKRL